LASSDAAIDTSITDVRNKVGLADYSGQLQGKLPLQITDKLNGPSGTENGTGTTSISFTIPCTTTPGSTTVGSSCSISTTVNAVIPGAAVASSRAVWELQGVQVFDGGADGMASTTGDNTLFADEAVFIP
jgi:hypothetical protein